MKNKYLIFHANEKYVKKKKKEKITIFWPKHKDNITLITVFITYKSKENNYSKSAFK